MDPSFCLRQSQVQLRLTLYCLCNKQQLRPTPCPWLPVQLLQVTRFPGLTWLGWPWQLWKPQASYLVNCSLACTISSSLGILLRPCSLWQGHHRNGPACSWVHHDFFSCPIIDDVGSSKASPAFSYDVYVLSLCLCVLFSSLCIYSLLDCDLFSSNTQSISRGLTIVCFFVLIVNLTQPRVTLELSQWGMSIRLACGCMWLWGFSWLPHLMWEEPAWKRQAALLPGLGPVLYKSRESVLEVVHGWVISPLDCRRDEIDAASSSHCDFLTDGYYQEL